MQSNIFNFKQKSQDFIVEEILPFKLSGKGDAFYVYFEKRNHNTMDIIRHLTMNLDISRMALGIAGLKDKKAITRQWISIYDRALKRSGGEKKFLEVLWQKTKILKTSRHHTPLSLSTPITNVFYIRLRANKTVLSQQEKNEITTRLQSVFLTWFANYFGEQRFGIEWRNWVQGKKILDGTLTLASKKETLFKIQAYASKLFNNELQKRIKEQWDIKISDGDILELPFYKPEDKQRYYGYYQEKRKALQVFSRKKGEKVNITYPTGYHEEIPYDKTKMFPTGVILWYNVLLSHPESAVGKREKEFLQTYHINKKIFKTLEKNKIYGLRRRLRVMPTQVSMKRQKEDLLMSFGLPSGSYASILIDILLKKL